MSTEHVEREVANLAVNMDDIRRDIKRLKDRMTERPSGLVVPSAVAAMPAQNNLPTRGEHEALKASLREAKAEIAKLAGIVDKLTGYIDDIIADGSR